MNISLKNGVTKMQFSGRIIYQVNDFNLYINGNDITFEFSGRLTQTVSFANVLDKFGQATAEDWADYLIDNNYFANNVNILNQIAPPTGVDATIVSPLPLPISGTVSSNATIVNSSPIPISGNVNATIVSPLPLPISGTVTTTENVNTIFAATNATLTTYNVIGSDYIAVAIRATGADVNIYNILSSTISTSNDDYLILLTTGGTVTGTLTYTANTIAPSVQNALGNGTQTLTGYNTLAMYAGSAQSTKDINISRGKTVLTNNPIYVIIRPLSAGLTAYTSLNLMI